MVFNLKMMTNCQEVEDTVNNNINAEKIVDLTQSLVEKFYSGDIYSVAEYAHDSIILIGETESAFCNGKKELMEKLDFFKDKAQKFMLKNQRYMCVYHEKNTYIVAGSFIAVLRDSKGNPGYKKQRSTFCWKNEKDGWKLYHFHLSNPSVTEYEDEKGITIKLEAFTRLSENNVESTPRIIVKDKKGIRRFVSEDEIIYIKADNMDCVIQCISESFSVRLVLKDVEAMVSKDFIRVHKSYIVNKNYVRNIVRYHLEMEMDFAVPVSKLKYNELKELFGK